MEHSEFCDRMTALGDAAKESSSLAELLTKIDTESAGTGRWLAHVCGKYPEGWENSFANWKAHGWSTRPVLMPHASKLTDLIERPSLVGPRGNNSHQGYVEELVKTGPFMWDHTYKNEIAYSGPIGQSMAMTQSAT